MLMKDYQGTIEEVVQETPSIKLFRISLEDEIFDYIPGQFVIMSLDHIRNEKDHLIKRSYSIASSPLNRNFLEFCITIIPDGRFTSHLDKLKQGDKINVSGPYGKFALNEPTGKCSTYYFIATGAGIAPLMSMMRTLLPKHPDLETLLLYGFRNPEDYCYKKELLSYCSQYGHFKICPTISTKNIPETWRQDTGRVTTIINKYLVPQNTECVYICGNPDMVKDTVRILHDAGLDGSKIHKEQW